MQLFVIRHAPAEDAAADQLDASRVLTPEGIRRFKRVVRGMRALDWRVTRAITSPWLRAASTAKLLRCDAEPIVTELLCQPPRAELLAMIGEAGAAIAVVGHEPWLGELVAWLAFGDMKHGVALELKKGGVVLLDGSPVPGGMSIHAIVPPRVLRAVGQDR